MITAVTRKWIAVCGCLLATGILAARAAEGAEPEKPWPADVPGHIPPKPGEHPRLFFRKADIPKLRERAKTPEGQAILKRLRVQLNGGDGETIPPQDKWTISSVAGYGMLYVITGEKKYANLGKDCMEKQSMAGAHNYPDRRYAFKGPDGALRAGPSVGWGALGYDLCYDGWDEEFRKKVADAIQNYSEGSYRSLPELARGARHNPKSNHWSMQVGGAGMALLAIMNDPGVDMAKIGPLLEANRKAMIRALTEGFGDGGYFKEGDGTGSMGHIAFVSALQAYRVAAGLDYYAPRPNAQWQVMRWFHQTVPVPGDNKISNGFHPQRGGYPHNIWSSPGAISFGFHSYFGLGFGLASEDQQAAMLWFYNHTGVKEVFEKRSSPFDTSGPYPHTAVLSFVNWPFALKEKNPQGIIPNVCRDQYYGFYAWRNRWQDKNDTVISILTKGWHQGDMPGPIFIRSQANNRQWGEVKGGFRDEWSPARDGSTILTGGDGSCLAIDFSQASGAEAMLVMTGPSAPADGVVVEAGGAKFSILLLTKGDPPQPKAEGNRIVVGKQTVSLDGGRIALGVFNK